MYRHVVKSFTVTFIIGLVCSGLSGCATSSWGTSDARKSGCVGTQCVLVKSAPAQASCRIIDSD